MKTLKIEWRHLDVEGETCDRCYDTGENLNAEIKRLNRKLESKGIKIEWFETKLKENQIPQSNTILFNGVPIEEIIDIRVSENYCDSCTELLEKETYCRTVFYDDLEYEDIPAKAIREATYKILNLVNSQEASINISNNAFKTMKIKIDEKEILVSDPNKNIVEIGDENDIIITAPCFRSVKRYGCCGACVIEINGIQKYACGTKPQDGMNIIYNRNDLDKIRKERLEKYAQTVKNNDTSKNTCCGSDQ